MQYAIARERDIHTTTSIVVLGGTHNFERKQASKKEGRIGWKATAENETTIEVKID